MVEKYYLTIFIVAIALLIRYLVRNKNIDYNFTLVGICVMFNSLGRYIVAVSPTLNVAYVGTKLLYIGTNFVPLMILFTVVKLSNINMNRVVKTCLLSCSIMNQVFVLSIGYCNIYYKNCKLVKENGYSNLEKVYGPAHVLYTIMCAVYIILLLYYLYYAIKMKKHISHKVIMSICVMVLVITAVIIAEKVTGVSVSILSLGYLLTMFILMIFFDRINRYDISNNIVYSVEEMKMFGYILFDKKHRFVGANDYIKEIFPEIKEWEIDKNIPTSDSYLYTEAIKPMISYYGGEYIEKMMIVGKQYFQFKCRELSPYYNRKVGYMLIFADKTAEVEYANMMTEHSNMLEEEVAEKIEDILYMKDMLILGMADMVESRDNNTGGHIKRTSEVVSSFAIKLMEHCEDFGISELFLKRVAKSAPMHDIGKISIDDKVLRKQGRYTDEEYAEMKKHTSEGARMIKQIMKNVEDEEMYIIMKNIAYYHHEKWDGTGYPVGLKGEEIPIEARIMALADVFDALVSKRCYKEAFSYDKAFGIIEESLGQHFDPNLGKIFLECRPILEKLYNDFKKKAEEENIELQN